ATNNPVVFHAASSSAANSWYGLVADSTATAFNVTNAQVYHASTAFSLTTTSGTARLQSVTVATNGLGMLVSAGGPDLTLVKCFRNGAGILVLGAGRPLVRDALISFNQGHGINFTPNGGGESPIVLNTTIQGNSGNGVYLFGPNTASVLLN